MMKKKFSVLSVLTAVTFLALWVWANNTPIGNWKTIDDETGEPKSYVKIFKAKNGMLYGRIMKLIRKPGEDPDPICDKCPDNWGKDKKIQGLIFIIGMKKEEDSNRWSGGQILDPKTGNTYDCVMWVEGNTLKVRGKHWTGLYRTQTWYRQ